MFLLNDSKYFYPIRIIFMGSKFHFVQFECSLRILMKSNFRLHLTVWTYTLCIILFLSSEGLKCRKLTWILSFSCFPDTGDARYSLCKGPVLKKIRTRHLCALNDYSSKLNILFSFVYSPFHGSNLRIKPPNQITLVIRTTVRCGPSGYQAKTIPMTPFFFGDSMTKSFLKNQKALRGLDYPPSGW